MTPQAWCVSGHESTHEFSINTGNSYYGGFQFDYNTWLAVLRAMNSAGISTVGWPTRADLATPSQQAEAFTFWFALHPTAWEADWATCGE